MFILINQIHTDEIVKCIKGIPTSDINKTATELLYTINHIHADIPPKKRISIGRYSIIVKLGLHIYPLLKQENIPILSFAIDILSNTTRDPFLRSLGIQLLSLFCQENGNVDVTLSHFEHAAMDEQWIVRECSAGIIRKLIKTYPEQLHPWYLRMAQSTNAMQRRFAVESLRPVADNSWFKQHPEFAFSILELLYTESDAYPRTSVGNSLSDWMRIDETRVFNIVRQLVALGDKNAYWIAYRACRNIVKKQPRLVMDTLKVDYYKYKTRIFQR